MNRYTMKYMKAKRMMHAIDKRLSALEKQIMKTRHLKMA